MTGLLAPERESKPRLAVGVAGVAGVLLLESPNKSAKRSLLLVGLAGAGEDGAGDDEPKRSASKSTLDCFWAGAGVAVTGLAGISDTSMLALLDAVPTPIKSKSKSWSLGPALLDAVWPGSSEELVD